jgi:hypothetical protein
MGILVPIVIFFGLSVILSGIMSETACKNIEHRRQPD